ncbi:MAG: hypothetical protein WBQ21_14700, partial [Solirubrobacteraceae bacterium]
MFDPGTIALLRQIGQDRLISIDRPDEHKDFDIYPGRHAYVEKPIEVSSNSGPEPVKTLQGHETIDGHLCNRYQLAFQTNADFSATIWEATDLNNFPIQMEFGKGDLHVKIHYHDVKLGEPDPGLFEVPKGYTRYASVDDMLYGKPAAALPEPKAEVDARVLKWHEELADSGDAYGDLRMGLRYRDGDGVPKDLQQAREWLQKSADQGDTEAATALDKLTKPRSLAPTAPDDFATNVSAAGLVIQSARFGSGGNVADVTDRVSDLLHKRPDGFAINAETMGVDPKPGKKKRLTIDYSYEGADCHLTVPGGR